MKGLVFTYLLTYGGAAASLVNPFLGLLVYIAFAILRPQALWHWSVPAGNYSKIVAIALLVGWLINGCGNWRVGRASGVVIALLTYFVWSVVGAATSSQQEVGWHFVDELSKIVLPFLVGITTIDSIRKLKALAWVILLSQGYVALELNQAYLSGFNRVQEAGFGGMDNNCVAISMVSCVGLAFFLGLGAPKWWQKGAAFTCATLIAHTVLLTFSRGGMLGLIVTGVALFILIPKQPKHYAAFLVALLIGARMAGPQVLARFETTFAREGRRDGSAQSRLDLWAACWDAMLRSPLLGLGPDHWPLVAHEYGFNAGKEAHSLWMQTGAELGFPGVGAMLAFYALCVARLWPLARGRWPVTDPWYPDASRMVIASITGFAVSAMFVSLEGLEVPYYIVLIGAGILKLTTNPVAWPAHQAGVAAPGWGVGAGAGIG
jgi:putative inorganic carbon (HCO3(-)) transporter